LIHDVEAKTPSSPKLTTSPEAEAVEVFTNEFPLRPEALVVAERSEPSVLLVQVCTMLLEFWAQAVTETAEPRIWLGATDRAIEEAQRNARPTLGRISDDKLDIEEIL
jgi:hypothetical protein